MCLKGKIVPIKDDLFACHCWECPDRASYYLVYDGSPGIELMTTICSRHKRYLENNSCENLRY